MRTGYKTSYKEINKTCNVIITQDRDAFGDHCCCGKAMSITQNVSICNLRYPACNAHAPHCHMCPALLYNIFPHFLINGTIFGKFSEYYIYVLTVSTTFSPKHFSF